MHMLSWGARLIPILVGIAAIAVAAFVVTGGIRGVIIVTIIFAIGVAVKLTRRYLRDHQRR